MELYSIFSFTHGLIFYILDYPAGAETIEFCPDPGNY